jgi:hypothetical protein
VNADDEYLVTFHHLVSCWNVVNSQIFSTVQRLPIGVCGKIAGHDLCAAAMPAQTIGVSRRCFEGH